MSKVRKPNPEHSPAEGRAENREWMGISSTMPLPVVPLETAPEGEAIPCLIIIAGTQMGQVFPVRMDKTRIGRSEEADFCIRDSSISRLHATLWRDASGEIHLRDLGSTNGTFVNGTRVEEAKLIVGDRIQLGKSAILKIDIHSKMEKDLHAQLYEAGTRDPLTGSFNRRYFDQHFEADYHLAVRHGDALSLMLIDIDNFKNVNDTLGHLAGDHVLRALAPLIANRLRKEDVLARYGGEEFVVILQRTAHQGALALAEAVRALIEGTPFDYKDTPLRVTVSIGVATLFIPAASHDHLELLAAADKAMYSAKQAGKNRVVGSM